MFESSLMLPLTDYAIKRSGVLHGELRFGLDPFVASQGLTLRDPRARAADVGWPTRPVPGPPG